jgi:hypothetical protein
MQKKINIKAYLLSIIFLSFVCAQKSFAFESTDNNDSQDNKRLTYGIFSSFQKSNFSFDTPDFHSILKWRDMEGYSVGSEINYKITDNPDNLIKGSDAFFSYAYSRVRGEGTDDDISNANGDYSVASYSVQKVFGNSNDYRFGVNLDLLKINNFTSSFRIGGFHKKLNLDMTSGFYFFSDEAGKFLGVTQRTRSKFSGVILGGKISHKTPDTENVLILDIYPSVSYKGKQFWPNRYMQQQHWILRGHDRGFGFKVGFEHYFKINNQNLKMFSSYESIKIKRLREYRYDRIGDAYDLEHVSVIGGTADAFVKGRAKFDAFNMGIGINF